MELHYQCNFFWVDVIDEDHNDRRESIDSVVNSVVLLNYMPHHTGRSIIMYRRGSCCFETQNEHTIQTKPLGVKEGLLTLYCVSICDGKLHFLKELEHENWSFCGAFLSDLS